jgi:alanine dehydrogenase
MNIGILRGLKFQEPRVALVPADVRSLIKAGHAVYVENGAGLMSNHDDSEYESAGAEIIPTSEKIYEIANLICKIQTPLPVEFELFAQDHICISILNLADNPELLKALLNTNSTFIAAEMIGNTRIGYPIFDALNEINGRLALIEAGKYLQQHLGGKGILLTGTHHSPAARLTVLGSGITARTVAAGALQNRVQVIMLDDDVESLRVIQTDLQDENLSIHEFSPVILREVLMETDVLIAAKHRPGFKSPILVTQNDLQLLKPGSLVIDLTIDQGGCLETSRPTTVSKPVFTQNKVLHFCVSPLSAVVPQTSSAVYSALLLPYIKAITELGLKETLAVTPDLRNGLNIYQGKLVNADLASNFNLESYDILELFEMNI